MRITNSLIYLITNILLGLKTIQSSNYPDLFFQKSKKLTLKYSLPLLILFFGVTVNAKNIYVAKNGNDTNPGTEAQPFLTISKAAQVAVAGDVVIISEGIYEELLAPSKSGTAGNPIVYRGKAGDKVVITAMQAINGWTQDQNSVYKAQVNWDLGQDNMVLHKDILMDLARWPNNIEQDLFSRDDLPGATGGGRTWLNYTPGIPNWNWENGGSIHFYGGAGFLAWTDYIKSSTGTKVTFDLIRNQNWIPEKHNPGYTGHGVKKGEFFLQGIRQALDYKNEWFYNKNTNTLYVQIEGGGKPTNGSVQFRKRTQTIKLNKNYIHIENLAVFGGAIDITGNNNRLFKVSSFYGNHTLGVISSFDSGRQSILITGSGNTVQKCEIAFGAGNGVYDKGSNNKLLNSYVHDFNYLGNYDCVLNTRGANGGSYRKNKLTRAGKDVIQGYVNGGEFAYNDVSLNNFVADDGGLLYTTNARTAKSSIHHNTFHDSQAREGRFKGTGIYLDNDSKNWDVHHNIVWNTKWTGIQINWNGTNLNIFNNTFCKNSATMGAWHKAGTAFSNVKVWNNITDKYATDQDGNQEEESTWEEQADKQNNLVSKPSFLNWNTNNFKLKSGAEAVDYGRVIDGYTDGYQGAKPDAGAYEFGNDSWTTGIDWDPALGPSGDGCYNLPGETCVNDCSNPTTWYLDADNDGLGDSTITVSSCDQPSGYVSNANDSCPSDDLNTCTIVHKAPGLIEAEEYTAQEGIERENTSDSGGGLNIGYIENGDYTDYKTQVDADGVYTINFRIASNTQGGTITLSSEGTDIKEVTIPGTGGWQNWETVSATVNLNTGVQSLRLTFKGANGFLFNLNWVEFTSSVLSNEDFSTRALQVYPNPVDNTLFVKSLKANYNFTIADIVGRQIAAYSTVNNEISIDVSQLKPGVYFLIDKFLGVSYKFVKR